MTSAILRPFGSALTAFAMAALVSAAFAGQARADTETRTVAPFHAIAFEGSWKIDVTVGKDQSVVLEGDKELLGHIKTEVVDGSLRVRLEDAPRHWFGGSKTDTLIARITVPSLSAFALEGSGDAKLAGFNGGKVQLAVDGSGDLTAEGRVETLALAVNGSGNADCSHLAADKVSSTVNGSGDITVKPNVSMAASVNGSGQISYIGDSAKVTSAVLGSGSVEKR